uniref:Oxidized purine nucleoside triphosphate hydrolase n=1 Tax=Timema shepardi TaxID=629360 RepID=A0A7R9AYL2_TIMSH|nr:unnamed protein product [Timema shepardi]
MNARKVLTLAIIRDSGNVLLGMKKRGFGKGKWNGFGGKVELGETIHQAAMRELQEECGLHVDEMDRVGLLEFQFEGDPVLLEVHVFTTTNFKGEPVETDEMFPKWFPIDQIPFDKMWLDDRIWFPLLLRQQKFQGFFLFKGHDTILSHTLSLVENFPAINDMIGVVCLLNISPNDPLYHATAAREDDHGSSNTLPR